MVAISQKGNDVRLSVRVQPRSSRSGISGMYGDRVRICLKSAPVDDAANLECCLLLSRVLGVPRSSVTVASGRSSRSKIMAIAGVTAAAVGSALAPLLDASDSSST